jgi:oligoendopeptidase F
MEEFNEYMWILKPHYYDAKANYYNYPYAIGCIIANLLYNKDVKYVKEFLKNTGKKTVEELIELDFEAFFNNIKGEFYE